MTDQWFIYEEGKQTGPYSFAQLQEEVKAGRLKESGLIWAEGFTEWQPASTVGNLFTPQQFIPPPPGQVPKKGGVKKAILIAGGVLLGLILLLVVAVFVTDDPDTAEPSQPAGEVVETPGKTETATANQTEVNEASPHNFNQDGISFVYPGAVFGPPKLEQKEGSTEVEMGGPYPDYIAIKFDSYFLSSTILYPYMLINDIDEYRAINEYVGETIDLLQAMLADPQKIANAMELPYLPEANAAQVFHSNVEIIEFKNGKGLRYLTTYYQDYSPVTNETLVYTFQGITADGSRYISVSIPVNHPRLPADHQAFYSSNKEDQDALENDYQGFITKTAQMLNESNQNEFNPPLNALDEMIKTLEIK